MKTQNEHMFSALPLIATDKRTSWIGSFVGAMDYLHCGNLKRHMSQMGQKRTKT